MRKDEAERMKPMMNRLVSLVLAVIFIISAMMTGTYGWQSVNQQAQNEKIGQARTYAVELLKLEKLPDGTLTETAVSGAAFYLFTAAGEQLGGRYVSDAQGKITVQLPKGDYYFEEADPGPNHTFDTENGQRKTRYPFTVVGGGSTEVTIVTAYNVPLEGPLTIRKILQNADGSPLTEEQEQQLFEFTVIFSDGGTYDYRIDGGELQSVASGGTIHLKHGQTAVFENIPVGVLYNVTETPKIGYITSSNGHQGNITEEGCVAAFVNTYAPEKSGSLTVSKEVKGEGADWNKEFTFTATVGGKEISFTLKHGESYTFTDLPIGTEYTVTETDYTEDGYIASVKTYTGTITGEEELLLPFVNVYVPQQPEEPGNLEIKKEVVGEAPDPNKEFIFEVAFSDNGTYTYRIDGGEPQSIASGGTVTLKAGQVAVIENLPHGVTYIVREIDWAGYLPAIDSVTGVIIGSETASVTFQNRVPDTAEQTGKIIVTKQLAGEYPKADEGKEFHFSLIVDGEEIQFTLKPGESKEFDLPVGAEYEIREDDYFENGYSQSIVNGSGTVIVSVTQAVVTNTFVGTVMVEIPGEKTWDLVGYPEDVKPDSILVRLMYGDRVVEEKTVTPDENGEWHYIFNAPKYDEAGNIIEYTVEEVPLYNFIPTYTNEDGNLNILNTYIPPVSIDPPLIQKVVDGDPGAPSTKFEFLLKGSQGAPMPVGSNGNTKILTLDGSGELEIGKIIFDRAGTFTYTISELNGGIQGWTYDTATYTMTVTVVVENGKLVPHSILTKDGQSSSEIIFTNTYERIVSPDKTVVSGIKTWNHGNNSNPPDSIVVYVYADGELYAQRQVTAQDNWTFIFELPKYAKDGHEIQYTVGEALMRDYEVEVNGYNLVNTYEPGANPDKLDVPDNPDNMQTGDNPNIWLWLVLMTCSLIGIVFTGILGRKRRMSKHRTKHSR